MRAPVRKPRAEAWLTVDGLSGLSNAGSVIVSGGGSLSTGNADETQSGGTTTVDGTLSAANMNLDGGILNGTGTVQADVINAATVYPGDPPGPLTVQGNFTQALVWGPRHCSRRAECIQPTRDFGQRRAGWSLNVTVTNGYTPEHRRHIPDPDLCLAIRQLRHADPYKPWQRQSPRTHL